MSTRFEVIHGSRDLVETLEEALVEARAGRLDGVIVIGCTSNGRCGWYGAYRNDMAFPWPRLQAAVDTAQAEMVRDGTADWE